MMTNLNTPGFIYIGLPHSGSTFLRSFFSYHPDLGWMRNAWAFMQKDFSSENYLRLIADTEKADTVIDMYELLAINFLVSDPDAMEQNRFKLDFNLSSQELPDPGLIPTRIKATLPNSKILLVLRNQVSWLQSHYVYHISRLPRDRRRFSDYLSSLDGKRVAAAGNFHITVENYQRIFGKENVRVLLLEQIIQNLQGVLENLCGFLGVKYVDFPIEKHNYHAGKLLTTARLIRGASRLNLDLNPLRKLRPIYSTLLSRFKGQEKQLLTSNDIKLIRSFYSISNLKSSELTGLDLEKFGYAI